MADDRTEDDIKARNKDRLVGDEMMVYSMFLAAAMAGGSTMKVAGKEADAAMSLLKERFI